MVGTPALRKYFCARISVATCENCAGTSTFSARKTMVPSGFRISLDADRNSRFEYGSVPAAVKRLSKCIYLPLNLSLQTGINSCRLVFESHWFFQCADEKFTRFCGADPQKLPDIACGEQATYFQFRRKFALPCSDDCESRVFRLTQPGKGQQNSRSGILAGGAFVAPLSVRSVISGRALAAHWRQIGSLWPLDGAGCIGL